MPFKSEAQRRKFYAMANRGEISKKEVNKWEEHTKDKDLPERVGKEEKKASLYKILKVANIMLNVRCEERKALLFPMLEGAIKVSSFGKGVGQLGKFVGKRLGMKDVGGYLTSKGAKGALMEVGELSKKTHGAKLKKIINEELARRKRMVGYGALGTAGTGAGALGYMLSRSGTKDPSLQQIEDVYSNNA